MANEIPLYPGFAAGSLTATLGSGATAMSSDALADVPAVDAAHFIRLHLFTRNDSGRIVKKETVYVTAKALLADTTATIERGMDGTSAQDWAINDRWVVGWGESDAETHLRTIGGRKEDIAVVADAGAALTLDLYDGNVHDVTLTEDCTISFTGGELTKAVSFILVLRQDATGGWAVTWGDSISWADASPIIDTTANIIEVFDFQTVDGGLTWLGVKHVSTSVIDGGGP